MFGSCLINVLVTQNNFQPYVVFCVSCFLNDFKDWSFTTDNVSLYFGAIYFCPICIKSKCVFVHMFMVIFRFSYLRMNNNMIGDVG